MARKTSKKQILKSLKKLGIDPKTKAAGKPPVGNGGIIANKADGLANLLPGHKRPKTDPDFEITTL